MKENNLIKVNPTNVTVRKGFNTREDYGDLRELKSSIAEKGFDPSQPLIVTQDLASEGKYILGAQGHRRLAASMDLYANKSLPGNIVYVILEAEDLSEADRNLDIIRLNTGEPLSFLAKAKVIKRAKDMSPEVSNRELAKSLGMSATNVDASLLLLQATPHTLEQVEKGKVTAYIVVELIKELKRDFEKVEEAVEKLIEEAAKDGKTKAKKPKKEDKEDGEEESAQEKAAREQAEKEEKEANEARKARLKELQNIEKRSKSFLDRAVEYVATVNKDEKADEFDKAVSALIMVTGAYLNGKMLDTELAIADKGEVTGSGDVTAAIKALFKAHKATVKSVETEAKEAADTIKAEAAAKVKAAKEALKA